MNRNKILLRYKPKSSHAVRPGRFYGAIADLGFFIGANMQRKCVECGEIKPGNNDYFYINKTRTDGLQSKCKKCRKKYAAAYRYNNKEKIKKYVLSEKAKEHRKTEAYRVLRRERSKKYYQKNKEAVLKRTAQYKKDHPEIQRQSIRRYMKGLKPSLNRRISKNIVKSIKCKKNGRRWESLVGYTLDDFMDHFEKQFKKGMTWDNYGEWHIDHIIPVSAFNFSDPEEIDFKKCWALKNLQPLWAKDNLAKSNKIDKPFQPSLKLKPVGQPTPLISP